MGRTSIPVSTAGKIYENDEPSPLDPPSGADRQAMVQTILGEAGNQAPVGQQAVASVIRNRAVNGSFGGNTPQGVVQAPNQFEPWNTQAGRTRMAAAASDPAQAAQADAAIAAAYGEGGGAPADPTNGALNFIAPKAQIALGRQMPAWAQGAGQDIGDHRFFGGAPQTTQVAQADPAALPANSQPAQGFAVPGAQAAAPSVNPGLMRAMASPYISDGTKKILGLVLTQQMKTAQEAADPKRALEMEMLQANIDKVRGKSGATEYGLTPIMGTDASGNQVLGTIGKDGSFKQIDTGGIKIQSGVEKIDLGTHFQLRDKRTGQVIGVEPKDLRGAESEKALGKAQGGMKASLPSDISNAEQTVKQIDDLIKNPGLSTIVGPLDQFRSSVTMGAQGRDALARYNQLKGKAFLSAYATLRGGGQITEVEGTKAENAMARMDRAQSEDDFKAALTDFRDAVNTGVGKMREKAGVLAPSGKTSAGVPWSVE